MPRQSVASMVRDWEENKDSKRKSESQAWWQDDSGWWHQGEGEEDDWQRPDESKKHRSAERGQAAEPQDGPRAPDYPPPWWSRSGGSSEGDIPEPKTPPSTPKRPPTPPPAPPAPPQPPKPPAVPPPPGPPPGPPPPGPPTRPHPRGAGHFPPMAYPPMHPMHMPPSYHMMPPPTMMHPTHPMCHMGPMMPPMGPSMGLHMGPHMGLHLGPPLGPPMGPPMGPPQMVSAGVLQTTEAPDELLEQAGRKRVKPTATQRMARQLRQRPAPKPSRKHGSHEVAWMAPATFITIHNS